jgi:hypothetical protein
MTPMRFIPRNLRIGLSLFVSLVSLVVECKSANDYFAGRAYL